MKLLSRSLFVKNTAMLASGAIVGNLITVLFSPILARIYGPDDFGLLAVYLSVVTLIIVVASLRYELAIPIADSREAGQHLLVICLLLIMLTTGIVLCVVLFGQQLLLGVLGQRYFAQFHPYFWLLPIGVLASALTNALSYWYIREKKYVTLSRSKVYQGVGQVAVQYLMGILGFKTTGLLTGDVFGRAWAGGSLLMASLRNEWAYVNVRDILRTAKTYVRYPRIMLWAGLANTASLQVTPLLFMVFFDAKIVGLYYFAYRLLVFPVSLVGQAIKSVHFSELASLPRGSETGRVLTKKLALALFAAAIPIYGGMVIVGEELFAVVFGEQWRQAGVFAQLLSPMVLVWAVASPLSSLLIIGDKLATSFFYSVLELVFRVIAVLLGVHYMSAEIAVMTMTILNGMLCLFSLRRFLSIVDITFTNLIPGLLRLIMFSLTLFIMLIGLLWSQQTLFAISVYGVGCILIGYLVLIKRNVLE